MVVVHGHSAHVFHGVETIDGSVVCYDTGDFVDDYAIDPVLRNDRSFLFELEVTDDGDLVARRLRHTEIDDGSVALATPGAVAWARERMQVLSEPFGTSFTRDGDALVLDLETPAE